MASARVVKEQNGTYTVRLKVKRPDGRWGTDTTRGFRLKGDAEDYRTKALNRIGEGAYTRPTRTTVRQLRDRWVATLSANRTPGTVRNYRIWSARFVDRFGQRQVTSLRVDDIEEWIAELRKEVSDSTVRLAVASVKVMWRQAETWGLVSKNVARLARPPRSDTAERKIWSASEIRDFLAHTETEREAAAIRLLLTTGIRLGELAGLRLTDVDLEVPEIRIRQTRAVVGTEIVTGQPKTAKSRRTIGLDARTAEVLARHLETRELEKMVAGPGWQESGLVFIDQAGRGIRPDAFRRRFQKLVASSGLPAITVHDARHSYATAALTAGQPVKLVSERLGHSNVGITLNVYAHALPSQDAALATAVAALIDDED